MQWNEGMIRLRVSLLSEIINLSIFHTEKQFLLAGSQRKSFCSGNARRPATCVTNPQAGNINCAVAVQENLQPV